MSKKKEDRVHLADKKIALYAGQLKRSKIGGLHYRVALCKLEDWMCIRKGWRILKDKGEL